MRPSQEEKPMYSFSGRGTNVLGFTLLVGLLVFEGYRIEIIGAGNIPLLSYLFVLGTAFAAVYTAIGAVLPSRMNFYEEFISVGGMRSRTSKDIPYNQITRVEVIQHDSRSGYAFTVAFNILGQPKQYDVPKTFPGGGMVTPESSEARDFAKWIRSKARLPNG